MSGGADADDRIVAFSKGKTGGNKPKKSAGIVITLSMREMNASSRCCTGAEMKSGQTIQTNGSYMDGWKKPGGYI